jgi:hypothetical protein
VLAQQTRRDPQITLASRDQRHTLGGHPSIVLPRLTGRGVRMETHLVVEALCLIACVKQLSFVCT